MTLDPTSIAWAIEFLMRNSDGDIFPSIPEMSALSRHPEALINALANESLSTCQPQPCRRLLVPKDDLSYRQATQLHPQDSVLLTAIVYQYGRGIEDQRLPNDTVFSYRFDPYEQHSLYGQGRLWNEYWTTASSMSEAFSHVLYCDIADFYNQVYHHTVENQLAVCGFPKHVVKWVVKLLKSTTQGVSRGIPIGPHAVHLLAECTLIPVDNSLKANGILFLRYADDFLVFCNSEYEAKKALRRISETLDKQQRLMLQEHKTKIFNTDEFSEHCDRMIEDRPINDDEEEILEIIRQYSPDNPYQAVTYNQVSPEHWKAFSEDIVTGIVNDYLQQDEIDYIRLRWFFRRLAQVGHHGALQVTLENIALLEPCLPSVCSYISSIQEIPPDHWETIGEDLLRHLESGTVFDTEFARLSVLSLFSKNKHFDHFAKLARGFGASDPHTRREILLAAKANSERDWLREHKEGYASMDPWQRIAFIYCASILPKDERKYFLKRQSHFCLFEEQLAELSKIGLQSSNVEQV